MGTNFFGVSKSGREKKMRMVYIKEKNLTIFGFWRRNKFAKFEEKK
mgnify:CR=1 FL=1